jgi:hypothetical protein
MNGKRYKRRSYTQGEIARFVTAGVLLVMALVAVGIGAVERQSVMPLLGAGLLGMAVTANQIIKMQDDGIRAYPVAASTRIYEGTLVFITAAGYADDDTATGVNGFIGIARAECDNSSGSAGDKWVEVYTKGDFELTSTGLAQTDVGMPAYADDNYAVVNALGSTSVRIGKFARYVSSTKAVVSIQPSGVGALEVAPLTTITIADAAGTPDYALQALTTSSPYGLATQAEAISLLYVIQNLQKRMLDLEARVK